MVISFKLLLKRGYVALLFLLLPAGNAGAQLSIGTAGLTLPAGAVLYADGLALQPAVTVTLLSVTLQRTTATAYVSSGASNILRTYEFSSPVAFSGIATIYYADSELNGNTESALQLAYQAGGNWTTTTGSTANPGANTVSNTLSGISFSKITATSNAIPLPLSLLAFTAQEAGAGSRLVQLHWAVAAETGVLRYEVQRSTDGVAYTTLGTVTAMGEAAYNWMDARPEDGSNYYRLLLVAAAGGAPEYSPVRELKFIKNTGAGNSWIQVSPNPTSGMVMVRVGADLVGTGAELVDAAGRPLQQFLIPAATFSLNLDDYPSGIYMLQTALHATPAKIIKQ